MIISTDAEKPIYDLKKKKNNSPESRNRRSIPQHNENHIQQTHNEHYPQW